VKIKAKMGRFLCTEAKKKKKKKKEEEKDDDDDDDDVLSPVWSDYTSRWGLDF
jgi:hypothetical protein